MRRRKQEERGVFFWFFSKKNQKNTPLSTPLPFGLKERLSYFKKTNSENC